MSGLPPLSMEERAARERRLQAEHMRYVNSIATRRSLPRLQSTIAGAGGKTNEYIRLAEERETERRQRHQLEADHLLERTDREKAHQSKVDALNARQQKKRTKAAKKKAKRSRIRLEDGRARGSSEDGETDTCDESEEKE